MDTLRKSACHFTLDACKTGNNRSTEPMTPSHVPTVAETSNMCLWNWTMRVHSGLHTGASDVVA